MILAVQTSHIVILDPSLPLYQSAVLTDTAPTRPCLRPTPQIR